MKQLGTYRTLLNRRPAPIGDFARVLVVDGDSFVNPTIGMGTMLGRRFSVGWGRDIVDAYHIASGGNTYSNMVDVGDTSIDVHYASGPNDINVVLACGGWINQVLLGGLTIAQTDVYARQYLTDRHAVGWYVYILPNQVTAYDESGDPLFEAWEEDDPTFVNNSRFHADNNMDSDILAYADEMIDWRDGGTYEDIFYTRLAYSRYPLIFGSPDQSTSAGKSHPTQYGVGVKADFVLPTLLTKFQLNVTTSIYDDLFAYWPLWDDGAANGVAPYKEYWCSGVNPLYVGANAIVDDEFATIGTAIFGAGYLVTSAIGATVAHSVKMDTTTGITRAAWVYPLDLNSDGSERNVCGIWHHGNTSNHDKIWFDTTAQRFKYSTSQDGTISNRDTVTSAVVPSNNTWTYVAAGYDASDDKIWISVNGETPVKSASAVTAYTGGSEEFYVGFGTNTGFHCNIKQLGYWKRTLSQAELISIYNGGVPKTSLFGD